MEHPPHWRKRYRVQVGCFCADTPTCHTYSRARRSKTSNGDLRGLNIHESIGHNSIGYLGGISDVRLDTLEDAGRPNVTTFVDFTTSKTWLYRSRTKRSAKARVCCRTLFLYCTIRGWICTQHTAPVAYTILFPSYTRHGSRQTWIVASSEKSLCYIHAHRMNERTI